MTDSYHSGELAVQRRVGVQESAARLRQMVRPTLPAAARALLDERAWIVLAGLDEVGRPWATLLRGAPGFLQAIGDRTLQIAAALPLGDPLEVSLTPGSLVGTIAIDLTTRRRMRLNGHVLTRTAERLTLRSDQVYSNCPKYIQRREPAGAAPAARARTVARRRGLSQRQREWLRGADTFFIATANPGEGLDASHRGGMPGFVRVKGDRLTWPDYAGNSMFNTLGNLALYPQAGLLVPDFETGATLHLTGRALIDWTPSHAAGVAGAERLVSLEVDETVEITANLPAPLRLHEYSPANPR